MINQKVMIVLFFMIMVMTACSKNNSGELTRIDVQKVDEKGNVEEVEMITDPKQVKQIEGYLNQIKWYPKKQPSWVRREDVLITLFNKFDDDMPESLSQYRIWFNNGSAQIMSNKEKEGYGKLNGETSEKLKKVILN